MTASSFGLIGDVKTALRLEERVEAQCVNCWDYEELDEAIDDECSVLVIDGEREPTRALEVARRASQAGRTVAMLGGHSLLPYALQAGCTDVLDPASPQRLTEFLRRNRGQAARGELTVCLGAHEGAGATVTAIAVASNLLHHGRVALVDMNTVRPALRRRLSLSRGVDVPTLARSIDRMTKAQILGATQPFGGLNVLTCEHEAVAEDKLNGLLEGLRRSFDHVVVDYGTRRAEGFRRLGLSASHVIMTGDQDRIARIPTGAVATLRQLEVLGQKRVHVVVNRFNRWRKPTVRTISRVLGQQVSLTLPTGHVSRAARELDSLTQFLQKEG